MGKISDSDMLEIIDLFQSGVSQENIARKYHVNATSISRRLIACGIKENPIVFSKQQEQEIVSYYLSTGSVAKTAKHIHVQRHNIIPILSKNNIKTKGVGQNNRKYNIDEHYFDTINTPNKAYIFGLLDADGCVCASDYSIIIGLQAEDKYLLERINQEMGNTKPLMFVQKSLENPKWKDMYRLVIYSETMQNALIVKGMIPRKSLRIVYPSWMPDNLHKHFIRGYFDGNGCIHQYRTDIFDPVVELCSTKNFCSELIKICKEHLNIEAHMYEAHKSHDGIMYNFRIHRREDVRRFCEWIYDGADIYMKRKCNRYIEYFNISNT